MSQQTWDAIRAQGYDVEEEDEGEDEEGAGEEFDEKKVGVDDGDVQIVSGSVDSRLEKMQWHPNMEQDESLR